MKRGYLEPVSSSPIRPVDIDFEAADEESIFEVLGRLDELGDRVDGVVSSRELEKMLAAMG